MKQREELYEVKGNSSGKGGTLCFWHKAENQWPRGKREVTHLSVVLPQMLTIQNTWGILLKMVGSHHSKSGVEPDFAFPTSLQGLWFANLWTKHWVAKILNHSKFMAGFPGGSVQNPPKPHRHTGSHPWAEWRSLRRNGNLIQSFYYKTGDMRSLTVSMWSPKSWTLNWVTHPHTLLISCIRESGVLQSKFWTSNSDLLKSESLRAKTMQSMLLMLPVTVGNVKNQLQHRTSQ